MYSHTDPELIMGVQIMAAVFPVKPARAREILTDKRLILFFLSFIFLNMNL